MKRLLTTFLVASLLITTTLSFSSCKKADTNSTENLDSDEWIPTVVNVITPDDLNNRDGVTATTCPYDCGVPLECCTHGYVMWPFGPFCWEHYHCHEFTAAQDCTPAILPYPGYTCVYNGVRLHRHVVSYTPYLYHIDTHVGGGAWGNE